MPRRSGSSASAARRRGRPASRLDRDAQPPVRLAARNKRDIGRLLEALAKRIGFRVAPGLTERVIYRELFPRGLTLLDLKLGAGGPSLNMCHVAARQEVRALLEVIGIEFAGLRDLFSVTLVIRLQLY